MRTVTVTGVISASPVPYHTRQTAECYKYKTNEAVLGTQQYQANTTRASNMINADADGLRYDMPSDAI